MFGQLLFMRLRAAEKALGEGRLDEAYRLATQPDIREHKRGKTLLGGLSEKFVARAREFYRADRFSEALMDLDRAQAGGEMQKEIDELRGYIRTVAAEQSRKEESQIRRVEEARHRIERGSLAAGRNLLERADEGLAAVDALRRKAEERAEDVKQTLDQVRRLMTSMQWSSAAERLRRAKGLDGHAPEIAALEAEVCETVLSSARGAIVEGRLSRAQGEIDALRELGKGLPARRELEEMLRLSREASDALRMHEYCAARRHTMSLARLLPDAKWVVAAIGSIRQIDELNTELAAGPLGSSVGAANASPGKKTPLSPPLIWGEAPVGARGGELRARLDETIAVPARIDIDDMLPTKLLLLVDGGGSYLLLRGPQASVGRVASEIPADVPIFSDISERHANLNRVDDDYFVMGARDIEIDGRKAHRALLRDGDRVVLGKKAKFTFRLPSRKSGSALLELSDTTKMPNDVRRVVLFNQTAMIGQSNNVHVYCRHAGPTLLLFERNGSLWLRAQNDGFVDTQAIALRLGEPVELGGVGLVLQRWKLGGVGA